MELTLKDDICDVFSRWGGAIESWEGQVAETRHNWVIYLWLWSTTRELQWRGQQDQYTYQTCRWPVPSASWGLYWCCLHYLILFCIIIHRDWKVDESRCLKSVDVCSLLQRRLLWRGDQTSGLLLLVNPHVLSVDVLEPTSVMRSVHDLYHVLFHFLH